MNIEEIVQNSRCRSCGYCFSVCPVNAIEMVYGRPQTAQKPERPDPRHTGKR